jgi:hypothetical protein
MIDGLFEKVVTFPDPDSHEVYNSLYGLELIKERLQKEAQSMLRPDLLDKWSRDKHGVRLPALDLLQRRPPLFIFAGDVGTGKTALASTFGDALGRTTGITVQFYCLSLRTRGTDVVRLTVCAARSLDRSGFHSHRWAGSTNSKPFLGPAAIIRFINSSVIGGGVAARSVAG